MRQEWEQFLLLQEKKIGKASVERWLRPLRIVRFDARSVQILADDPFLLNWFEEQMRWQLEAYFTKLYDKPIQVQLCLPEKEAQEPKQNKRFAVKQAPSSEETIPSFSFTADACDPLCSFSTLHHLQENELVYRVLEELCTAVQEKKCATLPNPIYLYGPHGSGKTHLLMATALFLKRQGIRAFYARAETFTDQAIQAMRAGQMPLFRQLYRSADLLLLDDVQFFARKTATQEELFHTFNTLHTAHKPILLSSVCTPQELEHIEPRLVSRFAWGIALPLHAIPSEEKVHILHKKSEAVGLPLSAELETFLLTRFPRDMGNLCRAVEALALRTQLRKELAHTKKAITPVKAEILLQDLLAEEDKRTLRPEQILQQVAQHYGVLVEDLISRGQTREAVLPRQMAMYLCRNTLQLPLKKIGELFGRHHTTVLSNVEIVQQRLLQQDPALTADHINIRKALLS